MGFFDRVKSTYTLKRRTISTLPDAGHKSKTSIVESLLLMGESESSCTSNESGNTHFKGLNSKRSHSGDSLPEQHSHNALLPHNDSLHLTSISSNESDPSPLPTLDPRGPPPKKAVLPPLPEPSVILQEKHNLRRPKSEVFFSKRQTAAETSEYLDDHSAPPHPAFSPVKPAVRPTSTPSTPMPRTRRSANPLVAAQREHSPTRSKPELLKSSPPKSKPAKTPEKKKKKKLQETSPKEQPVASGERLRQVLQPLDPAMNEKRVPSARQTDSPKTEKSKREVSRVQSSASLLDREASRVHSSASLVEREVPSRAQSPAVAREVKPKEKQTRERQLSAEKPLSVSQLKRAPFAGEANGRVPFNSDAESQYAEEWLQFHSFLSQYLAQPQNRRLAMSKSRKSQLPQLQYMNQLLEMQARNPQFAQFLQEQIESDQDVSSIESRLRVTSYGLHARTRSSSELLQSAPSPLRRDDGATENNTGRARGNLHLRVSSAPLSLSKLGPPKSSSQNRVSSAPLRQSPTTNFDRPNTARQSPRSTSNRASVYWGLEGAKFEAPKRTFRDISRDMSAPASIMSADRISNYNRFFYDDEANSSYDLSAFGRNASSPNLARDMEADEARRTPRAGNDYSGEEYRVTDTPSTEQMVLPLDVITSKENTPESQTESPLQSDVSSLVSEESAPLVASEDSGSLVASEDSCSMAPSEESGSMVASEDFNLGLLRDRENAKYTALDGASIRERSFPNSMSALPEGSMFETLMREDDIEYAESIQPSSASFMSAMDMPPRAASVMDESDYQSAFAEPPAMMDRASFRRGRPTSSPNRAPNFARGARDINRGGRMSQPFPERESMMRPNRQSVYYQGQQSPMMSQGEFIAQMQGPKRQSIFYQGSPEIVPQMPGSRQSMFYQGSPIPMEMAPQMPGLRQSMYYQGSPTLMEMAPQMPGSRQSMYYQGLPAPMEMAPQMLGSKRMSMFYPGPSTPMEMPPQMLGSKRQSMYYQGTLTPAASQAELTPQMLGSKRQSMYYQGTLTPMSSQVDLSAPKQLRTPAATSTPAAQGAGVNILDVKIKAKIEKLLELRQIISSGNKSVVYRLRWIKMLIDATKTELYRFVNVKGEHVTPEQVSKSKSVFVKSCVVQLRKLLRECESERHMEISSEVFYLQACFFMQSYVPTFGQDFGIDKDLDKARIYLERCLQREPEHFMALYKMGELYEGELSDLASGLVYFKRSARAGYNRAIYKIAMLYLNEPQLRTSRFIKYLMNLSTIKPDEIDLDLEDRQDVEEVIGLASYLLGRIYEGLYPADLSENDEFIQDCLAIAPVNYTKSLSCYNKSAKFNCLLAQVKLGHVYEKGQLDRPVNANRSVMFYYKASSSLLSYERHPEAMMGLAKWCLSGTNYTSRIIPGPCPEKAVHWCERAIEEFDFPAAYHFMGDLACEGIIDSDPEEWYFKAEEHGYRPKNSI